MIKVIQETGDFRDRDHALDATEAVLSVLGDHLRGHSPANLAAQLPPELADAVAPRGAGEAFDEEEFDRRVAERESHHVTLLEAHEHAIAVMTTVLSAVDPGEARKIIAQLPGDYRDLVPPDLSPP